MSLSVDQFQLYAEFGIAAEKAQVLELEAGNVALAFETLFVNTDCISVAEREMFRDFLDGVNRKTLGALLKSIKTRVNFDDSFLAIVDHALDRRNYLSHRFFPSHNFAIFDEVGRRNMIEELKEIQIRLDQAHGVLSAVSSALAKFSGRSDVADTIAQKLMERGRKVKI